MTSPVTGVTGVIGALGTEVFPLEDAMSDRKSAQICGLPFVTGRLGGRSVVVVRSGVGKVNAAEAAILLIDHYHPSEVFFTGIAGGVRPSLKPGDVVLGWRTAEHDYGRWGAGGFATGPTYSATGSGSNPTYLAGDDRLLATAERVARGVRLEASADLPGANPQVVRGIIVSGDAFIASPSKRAQLRQSLQADAVEMEGAAVAQVCCQQKVPCLVVRGISDRADGQATQAEAQYSETAAENSARIVAATVAALGTAAPLAPQGGKK